jgi:hypothetical protein
MCSFLKKGEFPACVISEKIRKNAWWQHHQTKLSMAWTSAIRYLSSLDSTVYVISMDATPVNDVTRFIFC